MKKYTVSRTAGAPDWSGIPALEIDTRLWCPPVDIRARAQIAWDDEALYVRLSAVEARIRAEHTGALGMPCEDSCLEFFFCPAWGDERYFNIEFNPNGCVYFGFGDGEELVRLIPEKDWFEPKAERTIDGWAIEYRVPHRLVRMFFPGYAPASGARFRANCFKCGDLTAQEHYFSWNPVTGEVPQFHRPRDFGEMVFE